MPKDDKIIEPINAKFEDVVSNIVNGNQIQNIVYTANYEGSIEIGNVEINCVVLEDGRRVLSTTGITNALGSRSGSLRQKLEKQKKEGRAPLPVFVAPENLKPFISEALIEGLSIPIQYRKGKDTKTIHEGFNAELLPEICNVWLEARRNGELLKSQESRADKAELLMRSLASVGIIALVDEATGYQYDRKHDALRVLLSKYIEEGLQRWLKTFPDDFFLELDRLYGNEKTTSQKRPQYYGNFINKYVYNPIENGFVKSKLNELNITNEGKRKARFHQWLTEEGRTVLVHQIGRVQGLMEDCPNIDKFKNKAEKRKKVSIAPYLFDEMNEID